jgi:hypothetical protein
MPRFSSWRHRVSQILTALRTLDCAELQRAQIEPLFGLQPRAALRLMAPLVSASRNGSWQVDRQRLMEWLEGFEQEVTEEPTRWAKRKKKTTPILLLNRSKRQHS